MNRVEFDRRGFLKSALAALGFSAIPGSSLLAAPDGWSPSGRAELVFGFISDSHVRRDGDPAKERVWPRTPTTYLENALRFFRDQEVDAVVHGGDMAHRGLLCELKFHADVWWRIFPGDRLPNGRKVERIFVTGNHEWCRNDPFAEKVYPDPEVRRANVLANDMPRHWEAVWREPYVRVWHRRVKGYDFFGEHFEDRFGDVAKLVRDKAPRGRKPFFIVHHMIPDEAFCTGLAGYSNAVMLFGHWHNTSAHLGTIHQREFAMINGPSLRSNDIPGIPGFKPDKATRCDKDEIQHGYLVRVYGDFVVFERHDFHHGGKVGPDLVLPLDRLAEKPFSPEALDRVFGAPAFSRGAKPSAAADGDGVALEIPPADANPKSRAYAYDIVIVGEAGKAAALRTCVYAAGCDYADGHPAAKGPTRIMIERKRLPSGSVLTCAVRPVSSLGTTGTPVSCKVTVV